MPTPAVLYGASLVSATLYPYSITIGSTEVAPGNAELESLEFTESGDDQAGTMVCRLWDPNMTLTITEEQVVQVHDNTLGAQVFLGFVLRRWAEQEGPGRYINIEAVGVSRMLDELLVPREVRPIESDQARVAFLWGAYAKYPLGPEMSLVALTNAAMPADDLVGMTLRTALTQTAGLAGGSTQYFVDSLGRLVWRSGAGVSTAPFNINVAPTPGGGNIAPVDLKVTRDGVIKNRYYVRAATEDASVWVTDTDSVDRYGPREDYIDAASSESPVASYNIAQLALGKTADPNVRAEFTTVDPNSGWRADQYITVTSAADTLTAEVLRIAKVTTTFWRGDGKRSYHIEAGKTGGRFSSLTGSAPSLTATPGQTIAGTIGTPDGTSLLSTVDDPQSGGFGPTTRRFITSGVYNSDFNATPANPDSSITNDNRLPFWTIAQESGTAFRAISVADPTAASGRSIEMTLSAGAAGDEGYLEQIAPVNGSQGRSFVYLPSATYKTGAVVNNIEVRCSAQFLLEDGVTTTGTAALAGFTTTSRGANTVFDVQPAANTSGIVPADAYWLRMRVGLRRGAAATTDTVTVTLHEVRFQTGGIQVFVADGSNPTTYGYGSLYQQGGVLWVVVNQGGAGGSNPFMYLDATNGNIGITAASTGAVVLRTDNAVGFFKAGAGQDPYLAMAERTDPGVSSTNQGWIYVRDNGAGKSQLCVQFSSGAVQVIATQP